MSIPDPPPTSTTPQNVPNVMITASSMTDYVALVLQVPPGMQGRLNLIKALDVGTDPDALQSEADSSAAYLNGQVSQDPQWQSLVLVISSVP